MISIDRRDIVVVVQCAATKRNYRMRARDLYNSVLFQWSRVFADEFACDWRILSAKHGLVHPSDVLDPYDCALPDLTREERREWRDNVAHDAEDWIGSRRVVVLAGNLYAEAFNRVAFDAIFPFRGLRGWGKKIAFARNNVLESRAVPVSIQQELRFVA